MIQLAFDRTFVEPANTRRGTVLTRTNNSPYNAKRGLITTGKEKNLQATPQLVGSHYAAPSEQV